LSEAPGLGCFSKGPAKLHWQNPVTCCQMQSCQQSLQHLCVVTQCITNALKLFEYVTKAAMEGCCSDIACAQQLTLHHAGRP